MSRHQAQTQSTHVITLDLIYQQNQLIISMLKGSASIPTESENEKSNSTWITEEETIKMLDLKPRSLFTLRAAGTLRYSTASGRKIKYLRQDVEKYLSDNSNLHSRKRK